MPLSKPIHERPLLERYTSLSTILGKNYHERAILLFFFGRDYWEAPITRTNVSTKDIFEGVGLNWISNKDQVYRALNKLVLLGVLTRVRSTGSGRKYLYSICHDFKARDALESLIFKMEVKSDE